MTKVAVCVCTLPPYPGVSRTRRDGVDWVVCINRRVTPELHSPLRVQSEMLPLHSL